MFKAAAKVLGARDDEQEPQPRKRKSGEKESGAPIRRPALRFHTKIAALGRYAGLRFIQKSATRLLRKFSEAADDTVLPELAETLESPAGNTLEWLNLWLCQENAATGHGLDDYSDTQQNRNSPHP